MAKLDNFENQALYFRFPPKHVEKETEQKGA
jgi:hypothetical protein